MTLVAAIQMTSSPLVAENLRAAEILVAEAARAGAQLVALPENFSHMGLHERDKFAVAERPVRSAIHARQQAPIQHWLASTAAAHRITLIGGTMPLLGAGDERPYAASLVFDAQGVCIARYDKLHLFDVAIGAGERYRESASLRPGRNLPANRRPCDTPVGCVGLSVCYDLRFPELYRQLSQQGAQILLVPSAFTATTGQAHWEPLLRARAIENQCWVIAPNQCGQHANGRETWGHSLIVSPWGELVACRPSSPGVVLAEINLAELATLRDRFPALQHRRL